MRKENFETCVRGIIIQRGKILICKVKGNNNYFFPGGHVEFGERADSALRRELKEEIGAIITESKFIGTNENFYRQRGKILHEINLVFEAALVKKSYKALEDHMEFQWVDIRKLPKMEIYPAALKNSVLKWKRDKRPFWSSQGFKK